MHNIKSNFDSFLKILKGFPENELPIPPVQLRPGPKIKFTDIEIIALSLTSEYMGIDSEAKLFAILESNYFEDFPNLLSRRQYNYRRTLLLPIIVEIWKVISDKFDTSDNTYIVDSTPLRVCRIGRLKRNKMGRGIPSQTPNVGYCAAQKEKYFGFKGHFVVTTEGVVKDVVITKGSEDDRVYFKADDIGLKFSNCTIVGDKGYIHDKLKERLGKDFNIDLQYEYRKNQIDRPKLPRHLARIRKKIETVFSNLKKTYCIDKNYAKQFKGFKTRIMSKICSMTLLQYLNKFINHRPINNIMYALK